MPGRAVTGERRFFRQQVEIVHKAFVWHEGCFRYFG